MTDQNWLIVFNPTARNGKNKKTVKKVTQKFDENKIQYQLVETTSKEHGIQVTESARSDGYTRVIALGGDGTAHHIANGAIRGKITLGLIPAGSGNDFAGALGLTSKNLDHSVEAQLNGQVVSLNSIKTTTTEGVYYTVNIVDTGIGAKVALATETRLKWLYGPIKYNLISLGTILKHKNIPSMITFDDGDPKEYNLTMLIGGVGQTAGAGMHFLPDARFNKDKMQAGLIHNASKLQTIKALNRVWKARHVEMTDVVEMIWAKKIEVEAIDEKDILWVESEGEMHGQAKLTLEVVENALKVIIPNDFSLNDQSKLITYNK